MENIGQKEITKQLTPLYDERPVEETLDMCRGVLGKDAPDAETLYHRFAADASAWMRGCTAYALGCTPAARARAAGADRLAAFVDDVGPDAEPAPSAAVTDGEK